MTPIGIGTLFRRRTGLGGFPGLVTLPSRDFLRYGYLPWHPNRKRTSAHVRDPPKVGSARLDRKGMDDHLALLVTLAYHAILGLFRAENDCEDQLLYNTSTRVVFADGWRIRAWLLIGRLVVSVPFLRPRWRVG